MRVEPAQLLRTCTAAAVAFAACVCRVAGAQDSSPAERSVMLDVPPHGARAAAARDDAGTDERQPPFGGRRLGMGAVVGYGVTIDTPGRVEIEPLAWLFGLRFEHDFVSGVRLGAYLDYALGDTVTQTYMPVAAAQIRVRAKTALANGGLSLGYDERLGPLVLRYALDLGVSYLRWRFDGAPEAGLGRYGARSGAKVGFHFAPGLGLLWPIDRTYVGLEYRYLIQMDELIPSGVTAVVHAGVRW